MAWTIRAAGAADVPAILGFWNPMIRDTAVTFAAEEKTPEGLAQLIAARQAAGRAFLVAEQGGAVLGLASYDQFRPSDGYRHTMEHTIILAEAAHGQGIGRALLAAIEDHARTAGAHAMLAAVSAENGAGLGFHAAVGYREVGRLPQVGRKLGRWMDLVLMQKLL